MMQHPRNESGFALATAILALVVVGALVTAGFFAASQESQLGNANARSDLAFYIAEQGAQNTLGTVNRGAMRNIAVGQTLTRTGNVSVGSRVVGNYTATVRPFGNNLFFVESLGTVTAGGRYAGAQRRVGQVLRTLNVGFPMNGALTTYGGITLRGSAQVSGIDTNPPDWATADCPTPTLREAGIYTRPETDVNLIGGPSVVGSPAVERDANLSPDQFEQFGELDFDRLAQMAVTLPASPTPRLTYNADGSCNTSDILNWGAPTNRNDRCYNHFPLMYYRGNLEIRGNSVGQGILLVDGNFAIGGGFEFYGIVIVRGHFNNAGSGNAEIHGTLLTKNYANIEDDSEFRGNPTLQFSTCAVDRAVRENANLSRLFPVQQRSWVDLTAAGVEEEGGPGR